MAGNTGMSALKSVIVPIHRAGYPFIAAFAVVTLLLFLLWQPLGWLGVVATAWCVYFFRDPVRIVPTRPGLVIAPADGVVSAIERAPPPKELDLGDAPLTRVSIFLNVFNVHVNRIPIDGRVSRVHYHPGKFLSANLDKASEENERCGAVIELADGRQLAVVQIAGLVARRIFNTLNDGDTCRVGHRFGLIRFGSRTDVYLPPEVAPLVVVGQTMVGGETVIADLDSAEPQRLGNGH